MPLFWVILIVIAIILARKHLTIQIALAAVLIFRCLNRPSRHDVFIYDDPDDEPQFDNSGIVLSALGNSTFKSNLPFMDRSLDMDTALSRGSLNSGKKSKRAIDGAVKTTRRDFDKYYVAELDESEKLPWWSAASSELYPDMRL